MQGMQHKQGGITRTFQNAIQTMTVICLVPAIPSAISNQSSGFVLLSMLPDGAVCCDDVAFTNSILATTLRLRATVLYARPRVMDTVNV
jgi:hypothetical protein